MAVSVVNLAWTTASAVGVIAAAGAGVAYFRYNGHNETAILDDRTIKSYKNRIESLEADIKTLNEKLDNCARMHEQNESRITDLQNKIDNTINIPLREIAEHMKETNRLLKQLINHEVPSGKTEVTVKAR